MLRGRATTGGIRHGRGQHRLCPGSRWRRARQGRESVAASAPMLMATPLPTLTVSANASACCINTLAIGFARYADTSLCSLPRQIRVALSARQLLPSPFAHALRITAHRHNPHKWGDRCSRKVKIRKRNFDFHGSDFTAHRLGVSAYNATENEVGAVGEMRAVGGHKSRTRGAAPYPVITYKSTL